MVADNFGLHNLIGVWVDALFNLITTGINQQACLGWTISSRLTAVILQRTKFGIDHFRTGSKSVSGTHFTVSETRGVTDISDDTGVGDERTAYVAAGVVNDQRV